MASNKHTAVEIRKFASDAKAKNAAMATNEDTQQGQGEAVQVVTLPSDAKADSNALVTINAFQRNVTNEALTTLVRSYRSEIHRVTDSRFLKLELLTGRKETNGMIAVILADSLKLDESGNVKESANVQWVTPDETHLGVNDLVIFHFAQFDYAQTGINHSLIGIKRMVEVKLDFYCAMNGANVVFMTRDNGDFSASRIFAHLPESELETLKAELQNRVVALVNRFTHGNAPLMQRVGAIESASGWKRTLYGFYLKSNGKTDKSIKEMLALSNGQQ